MRASSGTVAPPLRRLTAPSSSPFVCKNCISRGFSTSATTQAPEFSPRSPVPPPPPSGFAALSSRRLISVSGPDAAKYLQGVITSNILSQEKTARRGGFYTAFLNAQGRVLHDVFIYPDNLTRSGGGSAELGSSFLIEVDAAEADRLARHIKRYKLRAKFELRTLAADEVTVWHAWDDASRGICSDGGRDATSGLAPVRDTRSPTHGFRMITLGSASEEAPLLSAAPWIADLGLGRTPEAAYRVRRYLHGVAEGQSEILREQALPPESNMDLTGAIDWHKGCYVGQELTIRTRHRGVVRKRILPCLLYGEDSPSPPDRLAYQPHLEVSTGQQPPTSAESSPPSRAETIPTETSIGRVGKRGRSAGKWLAGVGNLGLALCRLEIMTDLNLPGEPAATAHSPDDEFVMVTDLDESGGSGRAVKVKAFVPDWLREGLSAQESRHAQT